MNKITKFIYSNIVIFVICGCIYFVLECIFRGYSSYEMIICAGIISVIAGSLNNIFTYEMLLQTQLFIGTIVATICEGLTGIALIAIYGENTVWDYSELWGTFFYGQCNIFFCMLWFVLVFVAILIADSIDYYIFDGERPYYKLSKDKIWFWLPERSM